MFSQLLEFDEIIAIHCASKDLTDTLLMLSLHYQAEARSTNNKQL